MRDYKTSSPPTKKRQKKRSFFVLCALLQFFFRELGEIVSGRNHHAATNKICCNHDFSLLRIRIADYIEDRIANYIEDHDSYQEQDQQEQKSVGADLETSR
jgi:hypothetical protein